MIEFNTQTAYMDNTIDELIQYYQENDFLDFKEEEYNDSNKANLIKDVLSLANSHVEGDKYIIIGVKKVGTNATLFDIESNYDAAHIQQYINSNLSPGLDIEYFPYEFRSHRLMVLRIRNPSSHRPYFTKKMVQFKNGKTLLRENECWIRKGSFQMLISREDMERIYARQYQTKQFDGEINCYFAKTTDSDIEITANRVPGLPSEAAQKEIQAMIEKKRKESDAPISTHIVRSGGLSILHSVPKRGLSGKSLDELKELLENVQHDHYREDMYVIFEKNSRRLNFELENLGTEYVEDASVKVEIPNLEGLLVANEVFDEPVTSNGPFDIPSPKMLSFDAMNYPTVKNVDGKYVVTEEIGNIKHHQLTTVFNVDLRMFVSENLVGETLQLQFYIYAKNLNQPVNKSLTIKIV